MVFLCLNYNYVPYEICVNYKLDSFIIRQLLLMPNAMKNEIPFGPDSKVSLFQKQRVKKQLVGCRC